MNKNLIAILLLGGTALYLLSRQKKCNCSEKKNLVQEVHTPETMDIPHVSKDIQETAIVQEVQPALPTFGKPLVMEQPNYQNYVDVKQNQFFEPKAGGFFRHG